MPTLKILRLGNPKLRLKSKRVGKKELITKSFQKFFTDRVKNKKSISMLN